MKTWTVSGADKSTGKDVQIRVEAADKPSAEAAASARGVLVEAVVPLALPIPVVDEGFTPAQRSFLTRLSLLHVAAIFGAALVIVFYAAGARAWDRRLVELQAIDVAASAIVARNESSDSAYVRWAAEAMRAGDTAEIKSRLDSLVDDFARAENAHADLLEHLGNNARRPKEKDLKEYRDRMLKQANEVRL